MISDIYKIGVSHACREGHSGSYFPINIVEFIGLIEILYVLCDYASVNDQKVSGSDIHADDEY